MVSSTLTAMCISKIPHMISALHIISELDGPTSKGTMVYLEGSAIFEETKLCPSSDEAAMEGIHNQ